MPAVSLSAEQLVLLMPLTLMQFHHQLDGFNRKKAALTLGKTFIKQYHAVETASDLVALFQPSVKE
ncbi:hypothetical protein BsIDN1_24190 [Bacillus safensis]|uniref:Uncharacterized protein n=1 Tax=Bacillus safensis TaxID=561879 RepID=A0A5S9M789_BACIA|nr:hypothetical protein BsIDN1_24190 [Bacillus safensis]